MDVTLQYCPFYQFYVIFMLLYTVKSAEKGRLLKERKGSLPFCVKSLAWTCHWMPPTASTSSGSPFTRLLTRYLVTPVIQRAAYGAMFPIHDILVWIRIRIHGYMTLINGSFGPSRR